MNEAERVEIRANKNTSKAYENVENARVMREQQEKALEVALTKLVNRKKGILGTSIKDFLETYQKLGKVNFKDGDGIKELSEKMTPAVLKELSELQLTAMNPNLKDNDVSLYILGEVKNNFPVFLVGGIGSVVIKQTITQFAKKEVLAIAMGPLNIAYGAVTVVNGISKSILADAEREGKVARNLVYQSEAIKEQTELEMLAVEAIEKRADAIADVLAKLNVLFRKNHEVVKVTIDRNGYNRSNYSKSEIGEIQTYVNIVCAIKDLIDSPLLDKDGTLTQQSLDAINIGRQYFIEMQQRK